MVSNNAFKACIMFLRGTQSVTHLIRAQQVKHRCILIMQSDFNMLLESCKNAPSVWVFSGPSHLRGNSLHRGVGVFGNNAYALVLGSVAGAKTSVPVNIMYLARHPARHTSPPIGHPGFKHDSLTETGMTVVQNRLS